jgi:hypothetical protein
MNLLLPFFLILHVDSCKVTPIVHSSVESGHQVFIDPSTDRLTAAISRQINEQYQNFAKKYSATIQQRYGYDTLLIIHQFVDHDNIGRSLVFHSGRIMLDLLTYQNERIVVCDRSSLLSNESTRAKLLKINSLSNNVDLPRNWAMHDGKTNKMVIEIRRGSDCKLFSVFIEGLPNSHFSEKFKLRTESEWKVIEDLMSK